MEGQGEREGREREGVREKEREGVREGEREKGGGEDRGGGTGGGREREGVRAQACEPAVSPRFSPSLF